jgi:hypothetical protein
MNSTLAIYLVRRWTARSLAGLVLLAAALAWPADAKQRSGAGFTLPDDLNLVPGDTGMFISVRVTDLLGSPTGKKILPAVREMSGGGLAELEKILGVPLTDVERLTVLNPTNSPTHLVLIVRTSCAYDRKRVLGEEPEKLDIDGKMFDRQHNGVVYLASDKVFMVGGRLSVAATVQAGSKRKAGPLDEALKQAGGTHHVVGAMQPEMLVRDMTAPRPGDFRGGKRPYPRKEKAPPPSRKEKELPLELTSFQEGPGEKPARKAPDMEQFLERMPPEALPYRPLFEARLLIGTLDVDSEIRAGLELRYGDEATAMDGETAARTAMYVAGHLLSRLQREELRLPPETAQLLVELSRRLQQSLKAAVVERDKTTIRASGRLKVEAEMVTSVLTALKQQAARQAAINDLKQLGLATHNYASNYRGQFFDPAILNKDGKPLLSWRVTLLPYIEQNALYPQFKLDEAWDSEHNKRLLAKMPSVYAPKVGKTKEPYSTYYRIFSGPNAIFDEKRPRFNIGNIPDGTSNTILIVEAAEAVPWTKPDVLIHDAKKPLPKLGAQFPEGFLVCMCDGSARIVRKTVTEKTLRYAIDPADGYPLGTDW